MFLAIFYFRYNSFKKETKKTKGIDDKKISFIFSNFYSFKFSLIFFKMAKVNKKGKRKPIGNRVKCPFCSKSYEHARSLYRHIKDEHPDDFNNPKLKSVIKEATSPKKERCPLCLLLMS